MTWLTWPSFECKQETDDLVGIKIKNSLIFYRMIINDIMNKKLIVWSR